MFLKTNNTIGEVIEEKALYLYNKLKNPEMVLLINKKLFNILINEVREADKLFSIVENSNLSGNLILSKGIPNYTTGFVLEYYIVDINNFEILNK